MRISDWNSDVCSSDLGIDLADLRQRHALLVGLLLVDRRALRIDLFYLRGDGGIARLSESIIALADLAGGAQLVERLRRSEEHASELQSLMRISYAVFCLTKTKHNKKTTKFHLTFQTKIKP